MRPPEGRQGVLRRAALRQDVVQEVARDAVGPQAVQGETDDDHAEHEHAPEGQAEHAAHDALADRAADADTARGDHADGNECGQDDGDNAGEHFGFPPQFRIDVCRHLLL